MRVQVCVRLSLRTSRLPRGGEEEASLCPVMEGDISLSERSKRTVSLKPVGMQEKGVIIIIISVHPARNLGSLSAGRCVSISNYLNIFS